MAKGKEPSQKQKDYAASIAKALNIKLPEEQTSAAYKDFISKNQERFAQSRPKAVHFTDEQIARANAVDILDYARSMGLELKRDVKDYRVKNYSGGFIITPEKNNWNWFDGNRGGGVVQLCMFLENKSWQEAVSTLINEDMEPIRRAPDWKPKEEPPKEFNLPPKNDTNKHVYAYLTKTRGIDADIVKDMLDKGYIYENQQRSCVFVGRDNEGVPRHASVRSTNTIGKVYKKDVSGSQKKYSFSISGTSGNLNVFEAPIDALSHMSLQKMQGKSVNDSYVALGGVTDKALERYLEDHKDIRQITVCTDGDEAGENAAERIKVKYGADYEIVRESSRHKDFNEDLVDFRQEEEFKKNLRDLLSGDKKLASRPLTVGKTPNALAICGVNNDLIVTIKKSVVDKCLRLEIRDENGRLQGKTGHGLTQEQLIQALRSIKNPVMVLEGTHKDSLVAVTDLKDDRGREVLVAIQLNKNENFEEVNSITSIYGRENFSDFLDRQFENGKVLAVNKHKTDKMLHSIGKKYPKENTLISYDDSIAYTLENVKFQEKENKKAEPLLQPIGKLYPKRGEAISHDATIANSMESVKYPENISLDEEKNRNEKLDTSAPYNALKGEENDERLAEKMLKEKHDADKQIDLKEWNLLLENDAWIKLEQPRKLSPEFFDSPDIKDVQLLYQLEEAAKREIIEDADYATGIPEGLPSEFFVGTVEGEKRLIFKQYFVDHEIFYTSRQATIAYMAGSKSLKELAEGIYNDLPDLVSLTVDEEHLNHGAETSLLDTGTGLTEEAEGNKEKSDIYILAESLEATVEDENLTPAAAPDNNKRRLFVDLDGTCALWQPVAEEELYEQGYYRNLPPYENVVKAVNELAQENPDIEVYVLSKYLTGSKYALQEKKEWTEEHLPNIPAERQIYVPYSRDKKDLIPGGLRKTDYLLDDFTNNFEGWQPPAKAIKLLNGINNTRGTWMESKLSAFRSPEELKKGIHDIVVNGEVIKDLPPQLDNTFDYEAFYDERQGYKYSNFADNHRKLLEAKAKQFNNRKTIVINAFGGAGAGKTTACMDICQQLKKQGYNAEYVSEYCKELVYENSDMLDGSAKNQFKILQEQTRRIDRLIGQVDFVVTDSPVLLNTVYNKELTPEYEEMVGDIFNQYQNSGFMIQRDVANYQTEGRIHTLEESMEKDNQIRDMLQSRNLHFGTYDHDSIHEIVENAVHDFRKITENKKEAASEEAQTTEPQEDELELKEQNPNDMPLNDTAPEKLIKLQGVYGHHKGTPAKELKIGDVLVWNGGITSEVVGMKPSRTGKTIVFQMKSTQDGEVLDRRMNAETLVVVQDKNTEADNNLQPERKQTLFHEKSFAEQVDEVLADTSNPYNALKVCYTPQLLLDVGCEQLPMLYTQQHLRDALKNKSPQNPHWHGLTAEQIKSIPDLLADPAIIFDSLTPHQNSKKSIMVVLDAVDNDNAPLIVSILPKGEGIYNLEMVDSNFITSIYGKDRGFENYINRAIENNSILYWNKTKSQELFMFQGLQLPEAFNNLDFNRILHQSHNIVKENDTGAVNQYKDFAGNHKKSIGEIKVKHKPVVINAFGGPGSGKSTSCMDICQQLKKLGYKAEYVQEYAKELVYDKNWELLDGSPENQFEILKEQLKRVDRLYNSDEVDFIVTDSPLLLNGVYNKSLTAEYDAMVTSLYNDFDNFTYFIERDASAFQEEGRIHNLEESQKIDEDIKQLLKKKEISYKTCNHDDIDKIVSDSVRMFNRINHIEEAATKKQTAYAERIAKALDIKLPEKATKAAYKAFINENQEEFLKNNEPLKEEGVVGNSYQDYLDMVTKNGSKLRDVPKEHYTDELLLSAVRNLGTAIRQIPEDRITAEIAMASVQQYGLNLKHVPEKLRNEEICIAAYISSSGKSVRYTPKSIKDIVKEEGQKRLAENNSAAPNSNRRIDTEEIQEQGQEWSARIENMLMEHETDPDAMIEDIAFASKFYQYSTRNIQLMRQQNRGITYVASASAFEKMGYHVKAGENAMIGRVPVFAKYITNEKKERVYSWEYTPEIKQKLKEGMLKEQQAVRKFQFVAAFYDISQTDCPAEDYPSIFHMGVPSELHQEAFEAMKEFAEKSLGFKVMVTDLKSISLRGNCEPDNKIIRINNRLESTMALSTLCHEIAHGIIHTSENSAKISTAQKECEADVMDIMLESSLGLSINGSRRDHFFNSFQKYKEEETAKKRPYKVTLEKLIDRVQSKVFRTYIEDINYYLNLHLPAEGSQNEAVTKEVIKNLALLDSAYDTDHRALINGENELFDIGRIESYKELYQQTREEYRLSNCFVPQLAILKFLETGKVKYEENQLWDLWGVQVLDSETEDMLLKQPEKITPEHLRNVNAGNIIAFKENVMSALRYYFVTEEGLQDMTEALQDKFTPLLENKVNCAFDMQSEYECLLNLLENGIKLEPEHMAMYEHICKVFDYGKNLKTDSGMRLMARINLATEGLSQNKRDLIAEYVFRTGNFEKAEKYAEQIRKEPDGIKKLLQEMKLVNSYKYMLRTIVEYENNMDVPETKRITTGAYNTSGIPILSKNVSSLSQINQSFLLIRKYASSESIKYYAIVEDDRIEDVYRIAYVELNDYQPEIGYSTVTFEDYEAAGEFYDRYLKTSNSRLVDGTQAEELVNLENKGNQIALSEITSIGKTIAARKQQYKESGLSEERALEMLRTEISEEYPEISSIENAETGRELQTLKDFKKMVNYYGEEHFIELCNLNKSVSDTTVVEEFFQLDRQLTEQKAVLDEMGIVGIDDVKQCVDAALDCSVTAADIEKAFNAIDSAVLTSEFSNLETEFEGFEEYNNVLDTLKAAHVTPDKFCYVDFEAVPGPYLYTSDLAGNIYRKSLGSEWDDSLQKLNARLKEAGYEICTTFDDFRAYAANNRLGIFNVPEKEKNEAYIRILESTSDMLPKNQVLSVYDFKSTMDKLSGTTEFHDKITYKLVTRKDQEIRSYIDTYTGNSEQNVYEQLYGKVQDRVPELSKVISKQFYQDQLNFNENHLVRPLLKQLKQENKSVDDSDELNALMDSNNKLEEEIRKLDLSPADAELLKLNAGIIRTEQIADIQKQQQMNQQAQQRKARNQQMEGMSM